MKRTHEAKCPCCQYNIKGAVDGLCDPCSEAFNRTSLEGSAEAIIVWASKRALHYQRLHARRIERIAKRCGAVVVKEGAAS